jgi:hypothetical protein
MGEGVRDCVHIVNHEDRLKHDQPVRWIVDPTVGFAIKVPSLH